MDDPALNFIARTQMDFYVECLHAVEESNPICWAALVKVQPKWLYR